MTTIVGKPSPDTQCWSVQLADLRDFEYVHAGSVNVDGGGALVFTNGLLASRQLVCIYGPHAYSWVGPIESELCLQMHVADDDD